jgi:hypothetical protein
MATNLSTAIKHFREFLSRVTFSPMEAGIFADSIPTVLFTRGDLTVLLRGTDAEEYERCVDELYASVAKSEAFSESSVRNLSADTFAVIFREASNRNDQTFVATTDAAIAHLQQLLESEPLDWEVYIPIEGLAPSGLPLQVGNINFERDCIITLGEIDRKVVALLEKNDRLTDDTKQWQAQDISQSVKKYFSERALARTVVRAVDADAARAKAKRVIRRTVDCINFFADRTNFGMWLSLPGEVEQKIDLELALTSSQYASHRGYVSTRRKLPLNQIATRRGFSRMSEMLAKQNVSDLEERLLTALQWAGRARVDPRPEESFLLYAIALEALLLGKKQDSELSYRLAIRGVHLVGAPDLESRVLAEKKLRSLYTIRSKIVHSGAYEISNTDLAFMSEYARIATFTILDQEPFKSMNTDQQLEEWFRNQLLGRPAVELSVSPEIKP